MARKPSDFNKATHSGKAVQCQICKRMIGRGKAKYVYHEQVSNFRGEDITHTRCPECVTRVGRRHEEPEPDYGGVLGADGQVHSDADEGL